MSEWISVEDYYPEFKNVLCLARTRDISNGIIERELDCYVCYSNGIRNLYDVTHWQPLPKTPGQG